jgi:hypothetical protein
MLRLLLNVSINSTILSNTLFLALGQFQNINATALKINIQSPKISPMNRLNQTDPAILACLSCLMAFKVPI